MPKYWLSCLSEENFEIGKKIDFSIDGYKEREFKKVLEVEPGDKFVYYVKGWGFGAICVAKTRIFIDFKRIWKDDIYPCRFERECQLYLPKEKMLKAKEIISKLSFVSEKLKKSRYWGLAFRGSLRQIPYEDFALIEQEMKRKAEEDK